MKTIALILMLLPFFAPSAFASAADAAASLGYSAAPPMPYGPAVRRPDPKPSSRPLFDEDDSARHYRRAR